MRWRSRANTDDWVYAVVLVLALLDAAGLGAVVWHGAAQVRPERLADGRAPLPAQRVTAAVR